MKKNEEPNFSPSYEELINELTNINSRLTVENIALKITVEKMRLHQVSEQEADIK